ncbi:hairy-related 5 [Osmerus mordax]|uniref:hairy-related 5 n=1 Tax=Osmerus mordax TaxID=8014 RepID=UPI003510A65D
METALPRSKRRVPKPLMEKRRRERINHSLETLRRLLLENTRNERLNNPKVEKAEILESVVEFLRTEHEGEHSNPPMKRALSTEGVGESSCKRRKNYQEGMRSCLLRVSHFINTKSQELEETTDTDTSVSESVGLAIPPAHMQFCQSAAISSSQDPDVKTGQHLFQHQPSPLSQVFQHSQNKAPGLCWPTQKTGLSHNPSSRQSPTEHTELSDSVWRPWPQ